MREYFNSVMVVLIPANYNYKQRFPCSRSSYDNDFTNLELVNDQQKLLHELIQLGKGSFQLWLSKFSRTVMVVVECGKAGKDFKFIICKEPANDFMCQQLHPAAMETYHAVA